MILGNCVIYINLICRILSRPVKCWFFSKNIRFVKKWTTQMFVVVLAHKKWEWLNKADSSDDIFIFYPSSSLCFWNIVGEMQDHKFTSCHYHFLCKSNSYYGTVLSQYALWNCSDEVNPEHGSEILSGPTLNQRLSKELWK